MKIHAYILCHNEEKILPYTLDHYSSFCDKIYLIDNESTDSSVDIAKKYPKVQVITVTTNNQLDEYNLIYLKSNLYKNSRGVADYIISCDTDEFLYGIENLEYLFINNIKLPKIEGYQMVSDSFPTYTGKKITDIIKTGFADPLFCKQIFFHSDVNINFGPGCHSFQADKPISTDNCKLKLLHYKYLGVEYVHSKNEYLRKRLSTRNQSMGFGSHYLVSLEEVQKNISRLIKESSVIL